MASPLDDDVFEKLRQKVDPKEQEKRQHEINERVHAQYEKAQQRVSELIDTNNTLPVTISSVRVLHASYTRRGFLERIFNPLLSANRKEPYEFSEALGLVSDATERLNKFDIFKTPISIFIDKPDPSNPSTTATDIGVYLSAQEKSRYTIRTGTEAGHAEGSAYANIHLRNLFGGAESFNAHASLGTRTRSAYSAVFETPILSDPDFIFEVGGLASSTLKAFASHEEAIKGGATKLRYTTRGGHRHELGYSGLWRQATSLASTASPTVRADAGDSFKSSVAHTWTFDRRDFPLLPSRGHLFRTSNELAGLSPLGGDVAFWKSEAEAQAALPLPAGVSVTAGIRAGLLYPLSATRGGQAQHSRLSDRFQLGGPTDVRGFRLSGLGPRDGNDAVGGDAYAAGGASILFPIPRVGKDTPLRLQAFINGGRLLALREPRGKQQVREGSGSGGGGGAGGDWDAAAVKESVRRTLLDLRTGLPSCAAGIGLVYAHPAARFELNFSLPLVIRQGEEGRKGVSFGVGVSFL